MTNSTGNKAFSNFSFQTLNERKLSIDDTILILFHFTNQKFITKDPVLLHKAFKQIKLEYKVPFIKTLLFDDNGVNTWSDKLDDALTRLEISELLPYIIVGNKSWYFLDELKKHYGHISFLINEDEKKQIIDSTTILKKLPQPFYKG